MTFAISAVAHAAQAEVLYETALMGASGVSGTWAVDDEQFLGVRFEVSSTVQTAAIGGHFDRAVNFRNNLIFGAIVQLSGANDFPNSDDLSAPDVLGTALLLLPEPSDEVSAPLSVELTPGYYALIFGSGLFGAEGYGGVPIGNMLTGFPDWISRNLPPENWKNIDFDGSDGVRFFIQSVPEPLSLTLFVIGLSFLTLKCIWEGPLIHKHKNRIASG